jgi:hypothetical protein
VTSVTALLWLVAGVGARPGCELAEDARQRTPNGNIAYYETLN